MNIDVTFAGPGSEVLTLRQQVLVLVGAILGMAGGAVVFLSTLGIFLKPIAASFNWSRADISLLPVWFMIGLSIGAPILGYIGDRKGWRKLIATTIVLLVLGTFMDMAPLIVITTPIFLPVAQAFGIDPVQFGVILILNLGIGLCTPPVGTVLFVGCAVGKIPIQTAMKSIWPFYGAAFIALMIVTYIPAASLWLPSLFHH